MRVNKGLLVLVFFVCNLFSMESPQSVKKISRKWETRECLRLRFLRTLADREWKEMIAGLRKEEIAELRNFSNNGHGKTQQKTEKSKLDDSALWYEMSEWL